MFNDINKIETAHESSCLRVEKNPESNIFASGGSLEDGLLKIWS